ncbi:TetR family transcriptional regulator [Sphingobium sp. SCG-1]|nr:TetR family transcriptional regulator [Sphingobium sp. SCG-1]
MGHDGEKGIIGELGPSLRADARRNVDALLGAAMAVFTELGVDAPMRTVATKAGVGVGTLYRHFPQRSDLIKAIIRREVDALVEAASSLAEESGPSEALASWMNRLVDFVATKRGLGPALHSGDPAYQSLPDFVFGQITPALGGLLNAAMHSGVIRCDVNATDLLNAALRLATPASNGEIDHAKRMVSLLIDGLHRRADLPDT